MFKLVGQLNLDLFNTQRNNTQPLLAGRHTRMEPKPFDPNRVQPRPLGAVDVVLILLLVDEQTPKDDSILTQVWFLAQVAQEGLHLNR